MSFMGNLGGPLRTILRRSYCTGANKVSAAEANLVNILKQKFPAATEIQVEDISGGCGSMYTIHIIAEEFRGHRLVKQHAMVNEALKKEIKDMHGLRIMTGVPS